MPLKLKGPSKLNVIKNALSLTKSCHKWNITQIKISLKLKGHFKKNVT